MSPSLPPLLPDGMPLLGYLPAFYRNRMQVLQRGYTTCSRRGSPYRWSPVVRRTHYELYSGVDVCGV
jgi:hypothetical protein